MKYPPSSFIFGETNPEKIDQLISEQNEKLLYEKMILQ